MEVPRVSMLSETGFLALRAELRTDDTANAVLACMAVACTLLASLDMLRDRSEHGGASARRSENAAERERSGARAQRSESAAERECGGARVRWSEHSSAHASKSSESCARDCDAKDAFGDEIEDIVHRSRWLPKSDGVEHPHEQEGEG